ncbi:MAG: hypothetical protein M3O31_17345 [Acidobacteriota bacterium]|nr:hypothetical protein [Acidobacteriota bacterium]
MSCFWPKKNLAQRRYLWRIFASMTAYVCFLALAQYLFHHRHPTGAFAIGLALAPALSIIASLVVVGLYIAEEQDEFVRSVFIRSVLWGVGGTLAFTTVRGFLELFTPMDKFPLYAVYPLFWVLTGLAQGAHEMYYRRRDE